MSGRLPDFLIIGAQKAGTTWLHARLAAQPGLYLPPDKDFEFFSYPGATPMAAFASRFADAPPEARIGDACASYFWTSGFSESNRGFSRDLPGEIEATLGPDTLYLLLLRDPVVRSVSAYLHHIAFGSLDPRVPLLDAPDALGLVDISRYGKHLARWCQVVDPGRICILPSPDEAVPAELIRRACDFLGEPGSPGSADAVPVFRGLARRIDEEGVWAEIGQPGVDRPIGPVRKIDDRRWTRLVDHETLTRLEAELEPDTARLAELLPGPDSAFAAWRTWPAGA